MTTTNIENRKQNPDVEIQKKLYSMERKVSEVFVDVGNKVFKEIQAWISKMQDDRNLNSIAEKLTVYQTEFQADTVIAYWTSMSLNQFVFTTDSDQAIGWCLVFMCSGVFIEIQQQNKRVRKDWSFLFIRTIIKENMQINQLSFHQYFENKKTKKIENIYII